jgi:hypothetical protein
LICKLGACVVHLDVVRLGKICLHHGQKFLIVLFSHTRVFYNKCAELPQRRGRLDGKAKWALSKRGTASASPHDNRDIQDLFTFGQSIIGKGGFQVATNVYHGKSLCDSHRWKALKSCNDAPRHVLQSFLNCASSIGVTCRISGSEKAKTRLGFRRSILYMRTPCRVS